MYADRHDSIETLALLETLTENKKMIRKILGVIAGYGIFVVSSLVFFNVSGQNPHAEATFEFQILTAVYGAVFSILGGYVLQLIARTKKLTTNYVLAIVIAAFATFSLIKADGSHWTQFVAIAIFAPVSVLGGFFYIVRKKK